MSDLSGPHHHADGSVTYRQLLAEAAQRFTSAGLPSPESDARRVMEEVTGADGADLTLALSELATELRVARFDDMVRRRCEGEPLQYVLGRWGFRDLDLMVDRRVLVPRPETEQVVEVALGELDRLGGREVETLVVDMGCGSGAIGLSFATERVRTKVWMTDVSDDALAVARANTAGIGRAAARVRTSQGSWFAALPPELRGRLHLVVSNPPYIAATAELPADVVDWEPGTALFADGDGFADLRTLVTGAGKWLVDEGVLVCELSPEQAPAMVELALKHFAEARVERDLAGRDRALVARTPLR